MIRRRYAAVLWVALSGPFGVLGLQDVLPDVDAAIDHLQDDGCIRSVVGRPESHLKSRMIPPQANEDEDEGEEKRGAVNVGFEEGIFFDEDAELLDDRDENIWANGPDAVLVDYEDEPTNFRGENLQGAYDHESSLAGLPATPGLVHAGAVDKLYKPKEIPSRLRAKEELDLQMLDNLIEKSLAASLAEAHTRPILRSGYDSADWGHKPAFSAPSRQDGKDLMQNESNTVDNASFAKLYSSVIPLTLVVAIACIAMKLKSSQKIKKRWELPLTTIEHSKYPNQSSIKKT